jgi:hypothetical protein
VLELGPLVGAAPCGVLPEGLTAAQDQPDRALDHFIALRLEEPAHLREGSAVM